MPAVIDDSMTKRDLLRVARREGLTGYSDLSKAALLAAIQRHQNGQPPAQRQTAACAAATTSSDSSTTYRRPAGRGRNGDAGRGKRNGRIGALGALGTGGLPPAQQLQQRSRADLRRMAKEQGVHGWHRMRKSELIHALVQGQKKGEPAGAKPARSAARRIPSRPKSGRSRRLGAADQQEHRADRLALTVRDAFWLHAYWEIGQRSIDRTEAALGPQWFEATPTLRLYEVVGDDLSGTRERVVRDIAIHGGTSNWYIDVKDADRRWRADVGYRCAGGRFFPLAKSNVVKTPPPGRSAEIAGHWNGIDADGPGGACDDALTDLFAERLRRPLASGTLGEFGIGALQGSSREEFYFDMEAEVVVYGASQPDAHVTIQNEPVPLREDGTFTRRYAMLEGRQILPMTAHTRDGIEERTIILAIERNTKKLDPMIHDGSEQ